MWEICNLQRYTGNPADPSALFLHLQEKVEGDALKLLMERLEIAQVESMMTNLLTIAQNKSKRAQLLVEIGHAGATVSYDWTAGRNQDLFNKQRGSDTIKGPKVKANGSRLDTVIGDKVDLFNCNVTTIVVKTTLDLNGGTVGTIYHSANTKIDEFNSRVGQWVELTPMQLDMKAQSLTAPADSGSRPASYQTALDPNYRKKRGEPFQI